MDFPLSYAKNTKINFFRLLFIQDNDLNPIWNEHFEFVVEDTSTQHLTVKIYDDDGLQASELLGCAQVKLSELEPGKVKDVWLKLVTDLDIHRDNKDRGKVISFFVAFFSIYIVSYYCLLLFRCIWRYYIALMDWKMCSSTRLVPAFR